MPAWLGFSGMISVDRSGHLPIEPYRRYGANLLRRALMTDGSNAGWGACADGGPPKVNFWEKPTEVEQWKEEHVRAHPFW